MNAWLTQHRAAFVQAVRRLAGNPFNTLLSLFAIGIAMTLPAFGYIVLDNLREGVLKSDIYDATLNPFYRDVLAHHGAVAPPCRVGDPDRKGKVESAIDRSHADRSQRPAFETLKEAQAYLDRLDGRWAARDARWCHRQFGCGPAVPRGSGPQLNRPT